MNQLGGTSNKSIKSLFFFFAPLQNSIPKFSRKNCCRIRRMKKDLQASELSLLRRNTHFIDHFSTTFGGHVEYTVVGPRISESLTLVLLPLLQLYNIMSDSKLPKYSLNHRNPPCYLRQRPRSLLTVKTSYSRAF